MGAGRRNCLGSWQLVQLDAREWEGPNGGPDGSPVEAGIEEAPNTGSWMRGRLNGTLWAVERWVRQGTGTPISGWESGEVCGSFGPMMGDGMVAVVGSNGRSDGTGNRADGGRFGRLTV